jgi:SET and MYND domain-containing protein 4
MQVGSTVLRFLQIISCNGIDVMEMTLGDTLDKCHPSTIGLGIYPTASLLNHSCDPVADIIFYDDRCVVRAVQPIRAGRELSINYGYVYYITLKEHRRKALQEQYFFECSCQACVGNWRLKATLPTGVPSIRCPDCGAVPQPDVFEELNGDVAPVECPGCGVYASGLVKKLGELEVSQGKAERALKDARRLRIDKDGIAALESHVTLLGSLLELPWKDYTVCMSGLKQCYSMLGNKRTVATSKASVSGKAT